MRRKVKLQKWMKIVDINNPGFAKAMVHAHEIEMATRHLLVKDKSEK